MISIITSVITAIDLPWLSKHSSLRADYLFRYARSKNWYLVFKYPRELHAEFGREKRYSLHTSNLIEAKILAADAIREHQLRLLEAQNRRSYVVTDEETGAPVVMKGRYQVCSIRMRYPEGMNKLDDGREVFATKLEAVILKDGRIVERVDNWIIDVTQRFNPNSSAGRLGSPRLRANSDDDGIAHINRWIAHKSVDTRLQKEAHDAWKIFREHVGSKSLKDCTRDDGRKLVAALLQSGNKSATVRKKVGHLCAMVNLAMAEGHLSFNPFSSIIPKLNDGEARLPLSEADMATIRSSSSYFDQEEWLLFSLCASTGMRRSEAYGIDREFVEEGIRYTIVARTSRKTKSSTRRIPFPDHLIPLLPAKIEGPLFKKDIKNLGRETLRKMRKSGVVDKDLHSTRHRAKDRLRAARCPIEVQYELLGHEKETVAQSYGLGSPVSLLKEWIEKIGS